MIGSVTRPVKELKGFARIALAPGEGTTLTFHLAVSQLGFHDRDLRFVVEPGSVEVMLGSSSEDIRLSGTFEIVGEVTDVSALKRFSTKVEIVD